MAKNPLIEKEARIERHRKRPWNFQTWLDDYKEAIDEASALARWAYDEPPRIPMDAVDDAIVAMEKEYQELLKAAGEFLEKNKGDS